MARAKTNRNNISPSKDWNEANTFSKLIIPKLKEFGYPSRETEFCDEQTFVRKDGGKKGPYDAVFKDGRGVLLLIEAKRQNKPLTKADEEQAFDYCRGGTFSIPPPYALVSNGVDFRWFKRLNKGNDQFSYVTCDPIPWRKALEQSGSGELSEQISMSRLIKVLSQIRLSIFNDLTEKYFPDGYLLDKSSLGKRRTGFEKILNTRKSFVDATLKEAKEFEAVRNILSSIALSLTLKVLFIKILSDRRDDLFPNNLRQKIAELSTQYPGILKAEPYDVLEFSDDCQERIHDCFAGLQITEAMTYGAKGKNPIGEIWDGLVESEELDLQVKSLGNVYTPDLLVTTMVDAAATTLGDWKDKNILEPSCGSGHFVREVYSRVRQVYQNGRGDSETVVLKAHLAAIEHIRAVDIDPFAIQTTQLGMFLELYRDEGLWKRIAPQGHFDFSKVVTQADFLEDLFRAFTGFKPDLVIGNPPYGISVTDDTAKHFGVGSPDSYGCFLIRGLEVLADGGHLIFVVSNTFLTTRTHRELREKIISIARPVSFLQLHRNAFRRRDVFCCLAHFRKNSKNTLEADFYQYSDAWPIHPDDTDYTIALETWANSKSKTKLPPERFSTYEMSMELMDSRRMPPHPNRIDKFLELDSKKQMADIGLCSSEKKVFPFVGGLASLFLFCADEGVKGRVRKANFDFAGLHSCEGLEINRGSSWVPIVKLWQLAEVRVGLQTSDDERFLRKTPGVIPNARRRNIEDVDLRLTLSDKQVVKLTQEEKENGIRVLDKKRDRHFVPFDKGGEQDTAAGELRSFWSPVDYWIDWSESAVKELRRRSNFPSGKSGKAYIRNERYYFSKGIRFTTTGLYAPTFELSFGGVFGHMGSLILPFDVKFTDYLLIVLNAKLIRYIAKNFLQHTVHTEIDIIRQIPIVVPTADQFKELTKLCAKILNFKKQDKNADSLIYEANKRVHDLYGLTSEDEDELATWFKRRYPLFGRNKDAAKSRSNHRKSAKSAGVQK